LVTVALVETAQLVQMVKTQSFQPLLLSAVEVEVQVTVLAVKWVALVVVVVTQITEVLELLIKDLEEEMVKTPIQFILEVEAAEQVPLEPLQALLLEEQDYSIT
jgi:hypothetical protein